MTLAAMQTVNVYPHGGETRGSWILGAYAPGVPHPAFSYGYNNLAVQRPPDPSEWPSAVDASGEFYYIDSQHPSATDASNPQGYPDQPRATIPEGTFPEGAVVIVIGGAGYPDYSITGDGLWTLTMPGTAANKCFFVGEGLQRPKLASKVRLNGCSHFISYGFETSSQFEVVAYTGGTEVSHYTTLRDWIFLGDGTNAVGTPIGLDGYEDDIGSNHVRSTYCTIANCDIQAYGYNEPDATSESDRHGCKVNQNFDYVWYIDNHCTDMSGDCIQAGNAGISNVVRPTHIWIARNDMHDCMENAVDIKNASHVIVSQNLMYDFNQINIDPDIQDTYNGLIVHDFASYVYIINNIVYNCGIGLLLQECDAYAVVGNIVYNCTTVDEARYNPDSGYGEGVGIHVRARGDTFGYIAHNTVFDCSKHIQIAGPVEALCVNNIESSRNRDDGHSMTWANGSDADPGTYNYNTFHEPNVGRSVSFDRGTAQFDFAGWQGQGHEVNGNERDPLMVDPANQDFNLQSGSPERNSGTVINLYSEFLTEFSGINSGGYSLRIDKDINGNIRGTTRGALEYAA